MSNTIELPYKINAFGETRVCYDQKYINIDYNRKQIDRSGDDQRKLIRMKSFLLVSTILQYMVLQ